MADLHTDRLWDASDEGHSKATRSGAKSLRVLEVIPGDGRGAAFVFARRQVASLAEAGVSVRVFYLSRTSPLVLAKEWKRLRREIREFRPTLLHAHFGSVTAFVCAVSGRVPLVLTLQGSDLNHNPDTSVWWNFIAHLFSHLACVRARRVITVSEQLRRRMWCGSGRAKVIPTGVDLNLFRPINKEEARDILGWEQGVPTVVFHAGGRPRLKGADLVNAAIDAAQKQIGPIRLMSFNGEVPCNAVPYWVNAADCVVLASVSEGSPNIVKEALACNVPVIASNVGDVAERLRGVQPSRIVNRQVSELSAAIADILREPRRSNGRENVWFLSEANIARTIRSLYEEAIQ